MYNNFIGDNLYRGKQGKSIQIGRLENRKAPGIQIFQDSLREIKPVRNLEWTPSRLQWTPNTGPRPARMDDITLEAPPMEGSFGVSNKIGQITGGVGYQPLDSIRPGEFGYESHQNTYASMAKPVKDYGITVTKVDNLVNIYKQSNELKNLPGLNLQGGEMNPQMIKVMNHLNSVISTAVNIEKILEDIKQKVEKLRGGMRPQAILNVEQGEIIINARDKLAFIIDDINFRYGIDTGIKNVSATLRFSETLNRVNEWSSRLNQLNIEGLKQIDNSLKNMIDDIERLQEKKVERRADIMMRAPLEENPYFATITTPHPERLDKLNDPTIKPIYLG